MLDIDILKRIRSDADTLIRQLEQAAPVPAPTPTPTPNLLWSAKHDVGNMSEWYAGQGGGEFNSDGGVSGVQTQIKRSGTHAAFLRIANVNGNQGVRLFRWAEPRRYPELYYSAWYYFPERYAAPNWWGIMQWKAKAASKNDPFFMLNVGNRPDGQMALYLYDWQRRKNHGTAPTPLPVGRWVNIEAFYRSAPDNTGRITVWQDGVQIFNVSGVSTRYADSDTHWALTNYTDSIKPDPATIYIDDAAISLSRIGTA